MNDQQFERYSRQMLLPQIGAAGQRRLLDARVLIVGAGGLGSPAALYLAGAGVGTLVLSDFDTVALSNLHRQILHGQSDIGRAKVESAREALHRLNPDVEVIPLNQYLQEHELRTQIEQADVVLDASDNFETRFQINALCAAARTPLVSGAAIRLEGQVAVFPQDGTRPCYRCLYREEGNESAGCDAQGVLGPVVGIIGAMQALEAIKLLVGLESTAAGKLLLFDALTLEWRTLKLPRDPACPVCGSADDARKAAEN